VGPGESVGTTGQLATGGLVEVACDDGGALMDGTVPDGGEQPATATRTAA
jgi:hypothetical protein